MSRAMVSGVVAGALALGALGATFGFTPGVATAEAAPSVSPFAGTYVRDAWTYTISGGGQITGTYLSGGYVIEGTLSGRVREDGSFSITQTETNSYEGRGGHTRTVTSRITYSGSMQLDGSGNIVVMAVSGNLIGTFIWIRQ